MRQFSVDFAPSRDDDIVSYHDIHIDDRAKRIAGLVDAGIQGILDTYRNYGPGAYRGELL